jgi:hypothetical protein
LTPSGTVGYPEADIHDRLDRVDLPDADGPGFVALNGGFGEANRSLTGQHQALDLMNSSP